MDIRKEHIAIIGGGVIGLSTAISLLEQKLSVTIYATDIPPNTTSDTAAAIWVPYKAEPFEITKKWCMDSLEKFKELGKNSEATGISTIECTEYYVKNTKEAEWMKLVEKGTPPYSLEKFPHSITNKLPLIDTTIYMPYLMEKFKLLGGQVKRKTISSWSELKSLGHKYVVNCAGMGAKSLTGDESLTPVRGQVLIMSKPEGLDYSVADPRDSSLTYVIPRKDDVIVGGTCEAGITNLEPDKNTTKEILTRAYAICPLLKAAEIQQVKVGLRPVRHPIRVEEEFLKDEELWVTHHYGHGGAGITLSWGSAAAAVDLLLKRIESNPSDKPLPNKTCSLGF